MNKDKIYNESIIILPTANPRFYVFLYFENNDT